MLHPVCRVRVGRRPAGSVDARSLAEVCVRGRQWRAPGAPGHTCERSMRLCLKPGFGAISDAPVRTSTQSTAVAPDAVRWTSTVAD